MGGAEGVDIGCHKVWLGVNLELEATALELEATALDPEGTDLELEATALDPEGPALDPEGPGVEVDPEDCPEPEGRIGGVSELIISPIFIGRGLATKSSK